MLQMSDTPLEKFIPIFAKIGTTVAFLVPTQTGYKKSIMDATSSVRDFLVNLQIHNYDFQKQGPENKILVKSYFVYENEIQETEASLYRPNTKNGDPRIWFKNLKKYCNPYNLLALISINKEIYIINLSDISISNSISSYGFVYNIIEQAGLNEQAIAKELLCKIIAIHKQGFIPSITIGDPGVGDTLEHTLGIQRNNSRHPDYKGIELKSTRLTRNGKTRFKTRSTLFAKVPDGGMTYREIVDNYGKIQTPRDSTVERLQIYDTLKVTRTNAYDLKLDIDVKNDKLDLLFQNERLTQYISWWYFNTLKQTLLDKHHETFWVQAVSETRNGIEWFRYDKILHTKKPNISLLPALFESDKITIDLAAHYKPDGKWRDHGVLFKMLPEDIPLLLGEPIYYDLSEI